MTSNEWNDTAAYKNIMLSYNPKILYSNELIYKIIGMGNKNIPPHINLIIKDFICDDQPDNLNKKTTNAFIILEKVHDISKENCKILFTEQTSQRNIDGSIHFNSNLRIDNNTPII